MVSYDAKFTAAVVQAEPVWMNADATIDKSVRLIEEAARTGARIVAFPEVFIPGYPYWTWLGDLAWGKKFLVKYHENSLELGDSRMQRLQAAARNNKIAVVMGYSERDGGSRYIAQVIIDEAGEIVGNRRKLKPTYAERLVYGEGTGIDYITHDFAFGRLGALNCWEHFSPLTKYLMYSMGEQVHVASWPPMGSFPGFNQLQVEANETVTRSYAIEGQIFVLSATQIVGQAGLDTSCDTDERLAQLPPGGGWARIYGPDGAELAERLPHDQEGIIYADIDLSQILLAKTAADPVGHYARPDVLSLTVDNVRHPPVRYLGAAGDEEMNARTRVEQLRLRRKREAELAESNPTPALSVADVRALEAAGASLTNGGGRMQLEAGD